MISHGWGDVQLASGESGQCNPKSARAAAVVLHLNMLPPGCASSRNRRTDISQMLRLDCSWITGSYPYSGKGSFADNRETFCNCSAFVQRNALVAINPESRRGRRLQVYTSHE